MPEFTMPTTPEQWAAIKPNETDIRCAEQHMREMNDGHEPYAPAVYAWARGMAAARLLERERCVRALSEWLAYRYGISPWEGTENEARRILEDAK